MNALRAIPLGFRSPSSACTGQRCSPFRSTSRLLARNHSDYRRLSGSRRSVSSSPPDSLFLVSLQSCISFAGFSGRRPMTASRRSSGSGLIGSPPPAAPSGTSRPQRSAALAGIRMGRQDVLPANRRASGTTLSTRSNSGPSSRTGHLACRALNASWAPYMPLSHILPLVRPNRDDLTRLLLGSRSL